MDFNLSARVDYEEQYITRSYNAYPTLPGFQLKIRDDQALFIKKIKWTPVIVADTRNSDPQQPLLVGIKDRKSDGGDLQFMPPIKMLAADWITVSVPAMNKLNRGHLVSSPQEPEPHVKMQFQIWGTLFTYKPNTQISDKELTGISLLDHNARGLSYLEEEAVNGLNDYIISRGGPDLRALPMSLGSIQALPEVFQYAICNLLFDPKAKERALTMDRVKSLTIDAAKQFAADAAKGTPPDKLDIDYLRELAKHMLVLGWKKD